MKRIDVKAIALLIAVIAAVSIGTRLFLTKDENLDDAALAAQGYDANVTLLGRLVYGEARGEPYVGQVAVAAVIMNRTQSTLFPHTIPGVIFQPGAFDAVTDGQIWRGLSKENLQAAQAAVAGWEDHYFIGIRRLRQANGFGREESSRG
jgi:N-acetylmuramoyl-L-alanine amidase